MHTHSFTHTHSLFHVAGFSRLLLREPFKKNPVNHFSTAVRVQISLYYGGRLLAPPLVTCDVRSCHAPSWNQWGEASIATRALPREVIMSATVFATQGDSEWHPLAFVNVPLFDHKGILKHGIAPLRLWASEHAAPPLGPHGEPHSGINSVAHASSSYDWLAQR